MKVKDTQAKFDKNIPVPTGGVGRKPTGSKYNFSKMEIGDSLPITLKQKQSIYSCVNQFNKTNETTIKIKTGKDENGVLRYWRVG